MTRNWSSWLRTDQLAHPGGMYGATYFKKKEKKEELFRFCFDFGAMLDPGKMMKFRSVKLKMTDFGLVSWHFTDQMSAKYT